MGFEIKFSSKAKKDLDKIDINYKKNIFNKIDELKKGFENLDIRKLKTSNSFRLRVGDYRVTFDIFYRYNLIGIIKIGHRKDIYKKR